MFEQFSQFYHTRSNYRYISYIYIYLAKQNILGTLSFRSQSRNEIIYIQKFVNQYRMRFQKAHY